MGPLVHGHYFNFGQFAAVPFSDGVEIRQSVIVAIRGFCVAREGNDVGATAAKGLQVGVREERCEVEGNDYPGFLIRVRDP